MFAGSDFSMSRASQEDLSKADCSGALRRISHIIEGLFHSLEELREVESILNPGSVEEAGKYRPRGLQGSVSVEAKPKVHLAVGVLKDMMVTLVSSIKTVPELQEV